MSNFNSIKSVKNYKQAQAQLAQIHDDFEGLDPRGQMIAIQVIVETKTSRKVNKKLATTPTRYASGNTNKKKRLQLELKSRRASRLYNEIIRYNP